MAARAGYRINGTPEQHIYSNPAVGTGYTVYTVNHKRYYIGVMLICQLLCFKNI